MKVLAFLGLADEAVARVAASLGEVTAVSIDGTPPSTATLEMLGRAGIQKMLHLWDDVLVARLSPGPEREPIFVSLLTTLVRRLESKVVVVGDGHMAWLGPALAEDLDLPHVTGVIDAKPAEGSAQAAIATPPDIVVQRLCLQGVQRLRGPLQCVLAVLPASAERAEQGAAAPKSSTPLVVESLNLKQLGVDSADLPRPLLLVLQPERRSESPGRVFDSALDLAVRLRQDGLAPPPSAQVDVMIEDEAQSAEDLIVEGDG